MRLVLGGLVVISLAAVAAYVLVFVSVVIATARSAHRRDQLARELDDVLAALLGDAAVGRSGAAGGRAHR